MIRNNSISELGTIYYNTTCDLNPTIV